MTNRDDFEELVHQHHALVYRTAWRLLRDDADAQDVAQEVFLRLARDRAPLAGARSPEAVLRWLAVHGALEHLRGASNRRAQEEDYAMEHGSRDAVRRPDEIAAERGLAAAAGRELGALAADLRVALELRYREGLTFAAIGDATGVSEPSAHERVQKGLARLRARLERLGLSGMAGADAVLEQALEAAPDIAVPADLAPAILARTGPAWAAPTSSVTSVVAAGLRALTSAPLALLAMGTVGIGIAVGLGVAEPEVRGGAISSRDVTEEVDATPTVAAAPGGPGSDARTPVAAEVDPRAPAAGDAGAATTEAPPEGTLTGAVVDADGMPLSGVRVHAFATERTGKMPRFERIWSSAQDGAFVLGLPVAHDEGQLYRIAFSHRDVVRTVIGPERVVAGGETALGLITLARNSDDLPGEFALALLVLAEDDTPLAGADVELVRKVTAHHPGADEIVEARGRTDDNGRVELRGDRLGAKLLRLDGRAASPAAGLATIRISVLVPGHTEEVVRVPEGAAISGRVLTVQGGVPEGFGLWTALPLSGGGTRWTDRVQAEIAPDGAFRIAGLEPGRYDLWGAGDGWSTLRLDSVEAGSTGIALFVKRADDTRAPGDHLAELHGRAVDAVTGEPLPIGWLDVEAERLPDGLDDAALRADGIPNELLHSVAQVMVPFGGVPPPTPEIHAEGLEPGRYVLTVFAKDRAVGLLGPIELQRGEVRRDLVVPVPRGATVSGTIRGPDGRPVEGAWLVLTGDGPRSRGRVAGIDREIREDDGRQRYYLGARARTGKDGRFRLRHLPPDLPLRLAAVHPKLAPGWSGMLLLDDGEERRDIALRLLRR